MEAFSGRERSRKSFPIFLVFGLILFFIFTHFFTLKKASAATSPSVITYQGKLLVSSKLATTTQRIYFLLYDQSATGTILYTASGTVGTPLHVSTTPTQGLFSIDLGGSGTNALSPAIFQNNGSVYLEVRIGSDTLTPRKQITASPYALNARYLDGVGANTISSTTYIPISDSSGAFNFRSTTIGRLTITSSLYNTTGQTILGDHNLFPELFGSSTLIVGNTVSTTGVAYGYGSVHTLNLISQQAANSGFNALYGYAQVSSSNSADLGSFSTSITGTGGEVDYYGTGSISTLFGLYGLAVNAGSGDVVYARGAEVAAGLVGSGDIATMMGLRIQNYLTGSGHVTSSYGIWINNPLDTGSGSVYNNYGLYLEDMTTGTVSNYSIFSTGGQSYHAGNFGIGDYTPASALTVGNGDLFQVDSNGDIIKIKNITYSWPSSQGASSTILQNNGSGTLSWVTTSSLGLGGGGGGSGTVNSGLTGQLTYYAADGTTVSGTSTIFILPSKNVGIGTSTPTQKLSVVGNISNIIDYNSGISLVATTSVGTGPRGVFVSGNYAYVANQNSNSISVVDVSNASVPIQIATTSVEGNPLSIYVSGRYAYVANYGSSTVSIVDISNPKTPMQIATTSVGTNPYSVQISGHYAYVANYTSDNISIVDISNPKTPMQIATTSVDKKPTSIYISGRYAYVVNNASDTISVVDISNPVAPIQIATTSVDDGPVSIYVSGRYAYVANNLSKTVSVVDISNPVAPVQIATTSVGKAYSIHVSGRYAYVANSTSNTISVVDISNPSAPTQITSIQIGTPYFTYVSGHYAYATNFSSNTISVIDISGTEVSSLVAHSAEVGNLQARNDIFAQGNIIAGTSLVVGAGGIQSQGSLSVFASTTGANSSIFSVGTAQTSSIFKIFANGNVGIGTSTPEQKLSVVGNISNIIDRNTTISEISTTSVGKAPYSIFVSGRYAYVANYSSSTISVVDVSKPSAPVQVSTTSVGKGPTAIYVSGRYAYVANYSSSTISVVDISIPKVPIQIATTSVGSRPWSIYVSGRYAYTANNLSNDVSIIDISNPKTPTQVATTSVGTNPKSVFVSGRYAYVSNASSDSMSVIDVSDPVAPVVVATTTVLSPDGVYVSGRYAYVASASGDNESLYVVDISNPLAPVTVATTSVGGGSGVTPTGVFVSGRYAYVTLNSLEYLSIVDVSNPLAPVEINTVYLGWTSSVSVFVSGRYAYTANSGTDNISVIDISGTEVSSLMAHSAEVGNIQSRNDIFAQGNIMAGTSLVVGAGGIMSQGPLSVFASSTGVNSSIFSVGTAQTSSILRVSANGNVGIGTSTPDQLFTVFGTSAHFNSSGNFDINLGRATTTAYGNYRLFTNGTAKWAIGLRGLGTDDLYFHDEVSGTTRVLITPGGKFGISTTTPLTMLHVNSTSDEDVVTITDSNGTCTLNPGSGASWSCSSDKGLKTNILPLSMETSLSKIISLKPSTFNMLVDNTGGIGFIAQEVQETIPEAVSILPGGYLGVAEGKFIPYLVGAVQQVWNKISTNLNLTTTTEQLRLGYNQDKSSSFNVSENGTLIIGISAFSTEENQTILSLRSNNTTVFSVSANGDVRAKGSYYGSSITLGTSTNPGDLAERVDIAIDDSVEPGDVMVVDKDNPDTYRRSTHSYEQSVAGIISTNPTIIVGNGKTDYTAVMAMVGRTQVKVSNENGNIQRGDLLITASAPGYAMKYDPTKDNNNKMVAVIGMALEAFDSSTCSVIPNECEESGESIGMTFVGKKILSLIRTGWVYNHNFAVENIKNEIQQLANAQGINLDTNPTNLTAQNNNGQIFDANGNLDLKNKSLLNVASIIGKDGKWRIDEWGNLIQKITTARGEREVYGLQSQSFEVVFSSSSQLASGEARIEFDDFMKEMIDTDKPMKISVTLTSDGGNGVFVAAKSAGGFTVKELNSGQSNSTFDWIVVANKKQPLNEQTPPTAPNTDMEISAEAPIAAEQPTSTSNFELEPIISTGSFSTTAPSSTEVTSEHASSTVATDQ